VHAPKFATQLLEVSSTDIRVKRQSFDRSVIEKQLEMSLASRAQREGLPAVVRRPSSSEAIKSLKSAVIDAVRAPCVNFTDGKRRRRGETPRSGNAAGITKGTFAKTGVGNK
jgi:hypothetical protein